MRVGNILDPIRAELSPLVWDNPAATKPVLKPPHAHWIKKRVYETLEKAGYTDIEDWLTLVLTGSLTTYQYSNESDVDVSLFVDSKIFPEWSRAEMIALMVEQLDGTTLPGTPFPLQDFVVGEGIKPTDLYKPGLRSGYAIDTNRWIVPPERERVHDVKAEEGGFYAWALQMADKMERLLRYEPDAAIRFWHSIHKKRRIDMQKGKGDYAESNIIYKMLANRGLFPALSEASGEYIAHVVAGDLGPELPSVGYRFHTPKMEEHVQQHGFEPIDPGINPLGSGVYFYDYDPRTPPEDVTYPNTPHGHDNLYEIDLRGLEHEITPDYELERAWHHPGPIPPERIKHLGKVAASVLDELEVRPNTGWFDEDGEWKDRHREVNGQTYDTLADKRGPGESRVGYLNGTPVASVTWINAPEQTLIGTAYTHPDYRGQGIFDHLTQDLRASGKPVDAVRWHNRGLERHVQNWAREAGAPTKPPNLRQGSPSKNCLACKMYHKNKGGRGKCWGYGEYEVRGDQLCDSFEKETSNLLNRFTAHNLQYDRDQHPEGKGLILQDGSVWTWPTENLKPMHMQYAYKARQQGNPPVPGAAFHIKEGKVWQYGPGRSLSPEQQQMILTVDPKLEMAPSRKQEQLDSTPGFGHGQNVLDILERGSSWTFHGATNIHDIAWRIYEKALEGVGSTINLHGETPHTRFGFAPDKATETPIPPEEFTPEVVEDFIGQWAARLRDPSKFVGSWVRDDGMIVLDVSEGHEDFDEANRRAWAGQQEAIWDNERQEAIPVQPPLDFQPPVA